MSTEAPASWRGSLWLWRACSGFPPWPRLDQEPNHFTVASLGRPVQSCPALWLGSDVSTNVSRGITQKHPEKHIPCTKIKQKSLPRLIMFNLSELITAYSWFSYHPLGKFSGNQFCAHRQSETERLNKRMVTANLPRASHAPEAAAPELTSIRAASHLSNSLCLS